MCNVEGVGASEPLERNLIFERKKKLIYRFFFKYIKCY